MTTRNLRFASLPTAVRTVILCWMFAMLCAATTLLINNTVGLNSGDYTGADGDWIQIFAAVWLLLALLGWTGARQLANRKPSGRGLATFSGCLLCVLLLFGLIAMLSIGTAGIGDGLFTLILLPDVLAIALVLAAVGFSFRPEVNRHLSES